MAYKIEKQTTTTITNYKIKLDDILNLSNTMDNVNKEKIKIKRKLKEPILEPIPEPIPEPILETSDIDIEIKNLDGMIYLTSIENNSVDLILTDPPYIISKDSGMNRHYNTVKANETNDIEFVKTVEEWEEYKEAHKDITNDDNKLN